MGINVKIDIFEGPLDLLLHLIKNAEVDIYDIPIAEITDQYIAYLKAMEELDLEVASEFLVMAATLIEIKSKMLLPRKKNLDDEIAADEDPRKELVEKLIEYKKYKGFASVLKEINESTTLFFKSPEIIDDIENQEIFFKNITVENLMVAFKKVVDSYENRYNKKSDDINDSLKLDEYKIEDKIETIKRMVLKDGKVYFSCFFINARDRMEVVVTFLAMLELIKLKVIKAIQYRNYDDITIEGQEQLWTS
jgi:segregation and condensation protein A